MGVRLYGRAVGNGSLSVVTAGFREALEGAGLLEGVVALDKSGGDEEQDAPPGALASDGVFTGNLNMVPVMQRGARHKRHWVQVTPNSTYVPKNLLGAILKLPHACILSASSWGSRVIHNALGEMGMLPVSDEFGMRYSGGGYSVRLHTVCHGVSGFAPHAEEIEKTRADFDRGQFRVIHFSTTEGERKGTFELVQAWNLLRHNSWFPKNAELLLVLDHHANAALQQRLRELAIYTPSTVRILPRGDMDAATMSRVLCHMHVVAAPSRGEGFGLLPLQARACGVPVVATVTTGHSAGHLPPEGVTSIRQPEELEPIDDGPGAMAPALHALEVTEAILRAHADWNALSLIAENMAPSVIQEWSWQKQLAQLVERLR
jgi:glycosyltransferase involved in cell wall biosynthesis